MVELAVVVPTFKERRNVGKLVRRLEATLIGLAWEVVFGDDKSPDGPADDLRQLAREKPNVRIGLRGLSRAFVERIPTKSAPVMAVKDVDLQHDEAVLPRWCAASPATGSTSTWRAVMWLADRVGDWDGRRAWMSGWRRAWGARWSAMSSPTR